MASAIVSALACTAAAAETPEDTMLTGTCSPMTPAERAQCLERSAQQAAKSPRSDGWIISLTTSPVDYSAIAAASIAASADPPRPPLRLIIRCRGGHTELTIDGPSIAKAEGMVTYDVNNGPSVRVGATMAPNGSGLALGGDVAGLLQALPRDGSLHIRVESRADGIEGVFPLTGFDAVRAQLAPACRWPHPVAKPGG
jgi:hypothetical protein